ncbi:MAG: hypothetical protein J5I93_02700 [Pirellulaceae bacterium]|nr:hypothetical protein [Pirellulaceae bacterium]
MGRNVSWNAFLDASGPVAWRELMADLGRLAPYCLSDRVLRAVASLEQAPELAETPPLDRDSGSCWALCVTQDGRTADVMRPGVVLPLRWTRRLEVDGRLPADLLRVANLARSAVRGIDGRAADFHLGWPGEKDWPDLSSWTDEVLRADSAFPALAAGLVAAVHDRPSESSVWATGQWSDDAGVCAVDGIQQKVAEVLRWPVRELFVPADNLRQARQEAAGRLVVKPLPTDRRFDVALAPLIAAWHAEPLQGMSVEELHGHQESAKLFEELAEYHRQLHVWNDLERAEEVYERRLLPLIAERCRDRLLAQGTPPPQPPGLVAIASHQPETIRTAVAVFRPTRCLILYTQEAREDQRPQQSMESFAERAANWCRELDCHPTPVGLDYDESRPGFRQRLAADLTSRVRQFRQQLDGGSLAVEVTPGTTMMKLALVQAVVEPEDWLICLHHEKRKLSNGKAVVLHGSEGYIVWQAGDGWQ